MITPVILAGGNGTRLWPLSRTSFPKQFTALVNKNTLLQNTLQVTKNLLNCEAPIIVCNNEHRFIVAEQMRAMDFFNAQILLEQSPHNTAPAIALAALFALRNEKDPILLVLPSDHHITDTEYFATTVKDAIPVVTQGKLVTFGVVPNCPETGYGYIKPGKALATGGFAIQNFVEKPEKELAQQYIDSGEYYWNSGIFLFKASAFIKELKTYQPEILTICEQTLSQAHIDTDFIRLAENALHDCPNISIDYAVMEKTKHAAMMPLKTGWTDLGNWKTLWNVQPKDEHENVIEGDVLSIDSNHCYLHAKQKLLVTLGVSNTVVVDTPDAVLVADIERSQEIKMVVEKLLAEQRVETKLPHRVHRPWGSYQIIDEAARFQVKHLSINPGQALSLQVHHHRSEHWVVVEGTARITRDEEVFLLSENESVYIPYGVKHRLENPGKIQLNLIEVQVGSYLGEDDIVRFEDVYQREMEAV